MRTDKPKCSVCAKLIKKTKTKTKTYKAWNDMRQRCNNPKSQRFHNYGGRGIKVCKRWDSFEIFFKDMGEAPINKSLDRINNDGNYELSNCRWATAKEQASNRRQPTGDRGGFSVRKEMAGLKFNMLLVLKFDKTIGKRVYWLCRCDCGTLKSLNGQEIRRGGVKSCGCLIKTLNRKRGQARKSGGATKEYMTYEN